MVTANIVDVYNIINTLEFEAWFKRRVLEPANVVKAYEKEKDVLEETFGKRFGKKPLEEGINYLDEFYHSRNIKDHCQEAHDLVAKLSEQRYELGVRRGELRAEHADKFVKYNKWDAIVHDVSKKVFPEELHDDSVEVNPSQRVFVKAHPIISYMMLKDIPRFRHLLPAVLFHEEFYCGGGPVERLVNFYLGQLKKAKLIDEGMHIEIKEENIPLGARILAVADAYASMIRRKKSGREIRRRLTTQKGNEFDPELVDLCLQILHEQGKI